MDVSPKTLREVEFREKMRGYHPEDVDQFLERVAAGIEVLQDRLRQAIERAQRAEQAATEAGGNDDALRRTLLLAQRTADLAVQEGREQAARIVTGAEQQAQAMISEAEQRVHAMVVEAERRAQSVLADSERRAQSMVADAEQLARRGHEDTLVEVRGELAKLEETRQRLQVEVDGMSRWVAEHRSQLRAALEEALSRVEQLDVSPAQATEGTYPLGSQPPPPSVEAPEFQEAQQEGDGDATMWAPAPPNVANRPSVPPPLWPTAEPEVATAGEVGDADPYFAELRRAISDHDPLGPRPEQNPRGVLGGRGSADSEG